ncbi:MAG: BatA domain-containing protein [Planctomycetes bacterium]|nr:BatA domain-containing protein [Planctomycetota bacterium]
MFLSPYFLIGLSAVAIPVLIHLLWLNKYTTTQWAATKFLEKAYEKTKKTVRVQHLLLLLIRIALIALLALTFAKPAFNLPSFMSFMSSSSPHVIFVLDTSMSMEQKFDNTTAIEKSKEWIIKQVWQLNPNQYFSILQISSNPDWLIKYSTDPNSAVKIIKGITTKPESDDLIKGIDLLGSFTNRKSENFEIIFISDLQRSSWETALLTHLNQPHVKIHVIDAGKDNQSNNAITQLSISQNPPIQGTTPEITAVVKSYRAGKIQPSDIVMSIDDKIIERQELKFSDDGYSIAKFQHPFDKLQNEKISVAIEDDQLYSDNKISTDIKVREKISVTCLEHSENPDEVKEFFYLTAAIASTPDSHYQLSVLQQAQLNKEICDKTDVLVIINIPQFNEKELALLEEFVRYGKGLAIFCGPSVNPEFYNEFLYKKGILPAKLGKATENERNQSHALIRFADKDNIFHTNKIILDVPVFNWFNTTEVSGEIIASFTNSENSAAIIRGKLDNGVIMLFTSSAGYKWNNLALNHTGKHVFVPFVRNLIDYLAKIDKITVKIPENESDLSKLGISRLRELNQPLKFDYSILTDTTRISLSNTFEGWKFFAFIVVIFALFEIFTASKIQAKRQSL